MNQGPLDYESPRDAAQRRTEAATKRRAARRMRRRNLFGIVSCLLVGASVLGVVVFGGDVQAIGFAWLLCLTMALPLSCAGLAQPDRRRDWAIAGLVSSLVALALPVILIWLFGWEP